MASPDGTRRHPPTQRDTPSKKRKLEGDDNDQPASAVRMPGGPKNAKNNNKKQHTGPSTSQIARTLPLEPHSVILDELHSKYDVLTLSVISSSKIEKRVTTALAHLGRFHPADMAVRPGVVMLHARAKDAGKMISVTELVRRRVGDSGQKWYQYNRLYEVESEAKNEEGPSVIEETVFLKKGPSQGPSEGAEDDEQEQDEDDDFEVMPSRFKDAVTEPKNTVSKPYMSVMLSRVPIPEIQAKDFFTCQTNEAQIEHQRRKKMGLA